MFQQGWFRLLWWGNNVGGYDASSGYGGIYSAATKSNASDALDKLRFLSVTKPFLLGDAGELEIRIKSNSDNGTITITNRNWYWNDKRIAY
ncbi:hypothetical protein DITRI_Ditri15bG0076600 [Diplodiscus trichospermus]